MIDQLELAISSGPDPTLRISALVTKEWRKDSSDATSADPHENHGYSKPCRSRIESYEIGYRRYQLCHASKRNQTRRTCVT